MAIDDNRAKNEQPSTYIMDAESAAETARLLKQDRAMTKGMGGTFPEHPDLSNIEDILDIGCGPGGWVLDVAYEYPKKQVVGIDISHTTIRYAQMQTQTQHLDNASFEVMDALKPLEFPDQSFDLVNSRFIEGFMPTTAWPNYLQECKRILRPGGLIRLTESEYGVSTSANLNRLAALTAELLKKIGYSFSPDGRSMGITHMMAPLLRKAGFQNVEMKAHAIEVVAETEEFGAWADNNKVVFQMLQPTLVKLKMISQEEYELLYQNAMIDMLSNDFCALFFSLTAWGKKA